MTKLPKHERTYHTGLMTFPALERTFKDGVASQRENSHAVTTVMIHLKAKELAKQTNVTECVGGPRWCSRFMRQNRLSVCSRTTVGQKLPDDWEEKVTNFSQFVSRRKDELNIQADWIKCQCLLMRLIPELLIQLELRAFLCQPLVTRKQASLWYSSAQSQGNG